MIFLFSSGVLRVFVSFFVKAISVVSAVLGNFFYSNEILKLVGGRHVCSLVNDLQYCD